MESFGNIWFIIAIIAIFYFLMIRPQQQQRKKEKKFSENLAKGDKVVTKSGMYGKVLSINEEKGTVVLETGAGKITFDRSALSREMSVKRNKPETEKKK